MDDVQAAFAAYPKEQLEKMWAKKSDVLEKIIKAKGGNDFNLEPARRERPSPPCM